MASEPVNPCEALTPKAWLIANRGRLLRFALVGVSGVLVNLAIFSLVFYSGLSPMGDGDLRFLSANAAGFVVSVFTNFLLNDWWTWGDRQKGGRRHWFKRLRRYYLTASGAGAVQLLLAWMSLWFWTPLAPILLGVETAPLLSVLTGISSAMVFNFTASHLWAFRDVPSAGDC